jgi:predicted acyl esterase
VRRGYVKIVGNSRGTGKSGGTFQYLGKKEIEDNYDLIECAAWQPCAMGMSAWRNRLLCRSGTQIAACTSSSKSHAPLFSFWDDYRNYWWTGGILANGFLKWVNNLINNDIHTDKSVLLEELGEEGFKETIAAALADKDICADPGLVEILKNPLN